MQVTVEKLPKFQFKLKIEIPAEKMHLFREKASEDISREIKVPGFRPGHVPPHVMEKQIGADIFQREVIQLALPYTYSEAIQQEKMQPITRPKINIISEEPFIYEATIATLPEIKIKDYQKIKIPRKQPKVEPKEIEEVLNDIRKREAAYKSVDREAKNGDRMELDFEGFDEGGASLESTKSKNHPLILGEGTLIKDFEKELVGLKAGDKKEFDVKFPKDYGHKPFQDKKVHFKVEVKKVEEVILPEITEELIEHISGKTQSIEELKKIIEANILLRKQEEENTRRENELLEEFLKEAKLDVPDLLLEEELDYMIEDLKRDLEEKRISYEKFLEQSKKTEADLRKQYEKEGEKRIKLRLILQHIFQEEKIEISEEELQKEIDEGVKMYPEERRKEIKKQYETNKNLRIQLRNRMMLAKLFHQFLK